MRLVERSRTRPVWLCGPRPLSRFQQVIRAVPAWIDGAELLRLGAVPAGAASPLVCAAIDRFNLRPRLTAQHVAVQIPMGGKLYGVDRVNNFLIFFSSHEAYSIVAWKGGDGGVFSSKPLSQTGKGCKEKAASFLDARYTSGTSAMSILRTRLRSANTLFLGNVESSAIRKIYFQQDGFDARPGSNPVLNEVKSR